MLELVDLDKQLSKETLDEVFPPLETAMGECQRAARGCGVPVVIVFILLQRFLVQGIVTTGLKG